MLIKSGVNISRLHRDIRRALGIFGDVFLAHDEELVVTSTFEGNHFAGSLHYSNDAFDIRNPSSDLVLIIRDAADVLGPDYDIIPEGDHIHVEFDPKKGR